MVAGGLLTIVLIEGNGPGQAVEELAVDGDLPLGDGP